MKELFRIAEDNDVEIVYQDMPETGSASACGPKGCYIALDYNLLWQGSQERVHTAHELGHCLTGSFYNIYSPLDNRAKHEACAERWAIEKLVPLNALRVAIHTAFFELWDLADYFCVTPEFLYKALNYWTVTRGEVL